MYHISGVGLGISTSPREAGRKDIYDLGATGYVGLLEKVYGVLCGK